MTLEAKHSVGQEQNYPLIFYITNSSLIEINQRANST